MADVILSDQAGRANATVPSLLTLTARPLIV
jgi:hypothetical protein